MGILKNRWIRIGTLLIGVLSSSLGVFAQDDNSDQMTPATQKIDDNAFFPFSVEVGGELWYPLTNFALKNNFGGVYASHASFQYMLFKRIYAGLEFQNNQISQVTPVTYRIATATANLFFYDAGIKVSYCSSETKDWFFTCSLTAGESWMMFNKVQGIPKPPDGFKKQAFFFSPRVCEGLRVNDELRIGLEVSYSSYAYTFDPNYVGIVRTYTSSQTSGITTMLGWGFDVIYFVGKAKS